MFEPIRPPQANKLDPGLPCTTSRGMLGGRADRRQNASEFFVFGPDRLVVSPRAGHPLPPRSPRHVPVVLLPKFRRYAPLDVRPGRFGFLLSSLRAADGALAAGSTAAVGRSAVRRTCAAPHRGD